MRTAYVGNFFILSYCTASSYRLFPDRPIGRKKKIGKSDFGLRNTQQSLVRLGLATLVWRVCIPTPLWGHCISRMGLQCVTQKISCVLKRNNEILLRDNYTLADVT